MATVWNRCVLSRLKQCFFMGTARPCRPSAAFFAHLPIEVIIMVIYIEDGRKALGKHDDGATAGSSPFLPPAVLECFCDSPPPALCVTSTSLGRIGRARQAVKRNWRQSPRSFLFPPKWVLLVCRRHRHQNLRPHAIAAEKKGLLRLPRINMHMRMPVHGRAALR